MNKIFKADLLDNMKVLPDYEEKVLLSVVNGLVEEVLVLY